MNNLTEILGIPEVVFVIKIFVAVCLIVVAVYAVLRIRDFAAGTMPKNGEYVTEFEMMRDNGLIDDKELSQVKSAVGKSVEPLAKEDKLDHNSNG